MAAFVSTIIGSVFMADVIAALRTTPPTFPPALRVKRAQRRQDVWEITFAPDGRATFEYGNQVIPGTPHINLAPSRNP